MFGPGQVADLRARVGALQRLTRQRVPEAEAPVGGAAPRRQQPVLVRRPGDRLHRRQVVAVLLHWEEAGAVPHQQLRGSEAVNMLSPITGGGRGGKIWGSPCCRCLRTPGAGGQVTTSDRTPLACDLGASSQRSGGF